MRMRTVIGSILILLLTSTDVYAADITYQGKVIDADTLKPIEGAVVLAKWIEERAFITGPDTRFKDSKETLTDKNGEWSIVGPKGEIDHMNPIISFLLGKYYTRDPEFIIYKPGYKQKSEPGGFIAYPHVNKKHNMEGIVLLRPGDTKEERKEYFKEYMKHSVGMAPFIPVKDPEKKLRDLDFSFEYPENVRWVGVQKGIKTGFKVYAVVGLKKARTREERIKAIPDEGGKLYLNKLIGGEREFLYGKTNR